MKVKFSIFSFLVLSVLLGGMLGLHWWQNREVQARIGLLEKISERQDIAGHLTLSLEKYRRSSAGFRNLPEAQVSALKSQLKSDFDQGMGRIEDLNASMGDAEAASGSQRRAQERALAARVQDQLGGFLILSAKIEPQLYLRDVYIKPEMRQLHDEIVAVLQEIETSTADAAKTLRSETEQRSKVSVQAMASAAGGVVFLFCLILFRGFWNYVRPLKKLTDFARGLHVPEGVRASSGFMSVRQALESLAQNLEKQKAERHLFISAVANDLRSPMVSLQTAATLLAGNGGNERQRAGALDVLRGSVFRLSRCVEDLSDLVQVERTEVRLDEKIVDLRDVVNDVVKKFSLDSGAYQLTSTLPNVAVWTLLDSRRMERVIANIVNKLMQYRPQGAEIDLGLAWSPDGPNRGVALVVREFARDHFISTGAAVPRQDLLDHWTSENGFTMRFVERVIKAHGGAIKVTESEVAGLEFRVTLPGERVAGALIPKTSSAPSASPKAAFELSPKISSAAATA